MIPGAGNDAAGPGAFERDPNHDGHGKITPLRNCTNFLGASERVESSLIRPVTGKIWVTFFAASTRLPDSARQRKHLPANRKDAPDRP